MNKKSLIAPILISIFAFIAVPVSVSAVTQRASEINVCVDWDTKEVKYSKYWEKCPARHTTMTLGSEGPTGPAGADGRDGRDGLNGSGGSGVGPQGPAGAKGDTGLQGYQGAQGPAGANGANGAPGPAGPTIRSDRDFGTSVYTGDPVSSSAGAATAASWSLPADSSGVWSYTVVLEVSTTEPAFGSCVLNVKDASNMTIGSSLGITLFVTSDYLVGSWGIGTGTGVVWVDDYEAAALANRDITVSPHFELVCSSFEDFDVRASITMVEASDVNSSITW